MNIISVAPLSGSFRGMELSYYSSQDLKRGACVEIKLRKKKIAAVVLESTELKNARTLVRSSGFEFKKIDSVLSRDLLTETFLQTAEHIADDHALSIGSLLSTLIPNEILKNVVDCQVSYTLKKRVKLKKSIEKFVLQTTTNKRFKVYFEEAQKAISRNASVFIAVPSRQIGENISRYFEDQKQSKIESVLLHNSLSKIALRENLRTMFEGSPKVVIAKPGFLSVAREDLGLIILEEEGSDLYRGRRCPFFDSREFIVLFAESIRAQLIRGASVLRTETVFELSKKQYKKHKAFTDQLSLSPHTKVIDMTEYRAETKKFQILSDESKHVIEKALIKKKKVFCFALRRGLASITVCRDCGTVVMCERCSAPQRLFNTETGRMFVCGKCGLRTTALRTCKNCNGFRLEALGIGIDRVHDELKKLFSTATIYRMDRDTTKTQKGASAAMREFGRLGDILLGTEMALPYFSKKLDTAIIISLDSLFSIPDFRINARIFSLLIKIHERTSKNFLVQTRNPDAEVLNLFLTGSISKFHQNDLKDRKRFLYPPYQKLIKITFCEKASFLEEKKKKVKRYFQQYEPDLYAAFTKKIRGKMVVNALLSLPGNKPLPEDLKKRLRMLPPYFEIHSDPENVL